LLGLLAAVIALYASAPYGPGAGADSLDYLSTAENLNRGLGFTDFSGDAFRLWPPLYPLALALIARLSGAGVLEAARWLNALCFGLAAALAGVLLLRTLPERPLWSALASLGVMCMPSFASLGTIVSADMAFIALCWAFLWACSVYLLQPGWQPLLGMVALAAPAAVLRWQGVTLIMSGALLVLWRQGHRRRQGWLQALGFGIIASLPFAAWVLGRNYRLFGDLFGPRDSSPVVISQNLLDAWQRMGRWFLPLSLTERIPQAIFALAGLALLLWLLRRGGWSGLRRRLDSPALQPVLLFTPLYLLFDLLTRIPGDHPEWFDDRYYLPVFVCLLMLGAVFLEQVAENAQPKMGRRAAGSVQPKRGRQAVSLALAGLGLLWLLYPAYQGYKYLLDARRGEQALYNIYNTPRYREARIALLLQKGEIPAQATIYSNHPGLVYYFSGRRSLRSPTDPINYEADEQLVSELHQGWPGETEAYLVWWKPNPYDHFFAPTHLEQVAELQLLVNSKEGNLYLVKPKE
jgi:hypothetical protein